MLSMMDRLWRPDLTEADALDLMHRGIEEVRTKRAALCARECTVPLHGCWLLAALPVWGLLLWAYGGQAAPGAVVVRAKRCVFHATDAPLCIVVHWLP